MMDRASAETPIEPDRLRLTESADTAGGLPAIAGSLRFALGEAGLARGTEALLRMNQFEGFDCPGCAWPDPDAPVRGRVL